MIALEALVIVLVWLVLEHLLLRPALRIYVWAEHRWFGMSDDEHRRLTGG